MGPWIGFSHNAPSLLQEIEKAKQQWRGGGGGGALKMGGMMLACPEVCLPTVNRGEFSLGAALAPSLPCTYRENCKERQEILIPIKQVATGNSPLVDMIYYSAIKSSSLPHIILHLQGAKLKKKSCLCVNSFKKEKKLF